MELFGWARDEIRGFGVGSVLFEGTTIEVGEVEPNAGPKIVLDEEAVTGRARDREYRERKWGSCRVARERAWWEL